MLNLEEETKDLLNQKSCIIFICSDRTFIPHQIGFQRIDAASMCDAPSVRNGAEKIIDLNGHIVGIAISPDYKALLYPPSKIFAEKYSLYLKFQLTFRTLVKNFTPRVPIYIFNAPPQG